MGDDQVRAELQTLLVEARTVREHLDDFAARAGNELGGGTECSISLRHAARDRLAASSSPRAQLCDDAELRHGSGPCVTAMDELQVVLVPDVERELRWEHWTSRVRQVGFRSSAAVPARVADGVHVALNMYCDRLDAWDQERLLRAGAFASQVAHTVGLCLQVADLARRVDDLASAVAARDVINQAVGVVMVTNRCPADEALVVIRSASTHRNVDIVQVAQTLVQGVTGQEARTLDLEDAEAAGEER